MTAWERSYDNKCCRFVDYHIENKVWQWYALVDGNLDMYGENETDVKL